VVTLSFVLKISHHKRRSFALSRYLRCTVLP